MKPEELKDWEQSQEEWKRQLEDDRRHEHPWRWFFVGFMGLLVVNMAFALIMNWAFPVKASFGNHAYLVMNLMLRNGIFALALDVILLLVVIRWRYLATGVLAMMGVTFLIPYTCGFVFTLGAR